MVPPRVGDDAVHGRTGRARCPCPAALVVKNRSKISLPDVRAHAGAGVAHGELDEYAQALSPGWGSDRPPPKPDGRVPDDQLAAVGHRVAGVDRQVEQHLLQLARVRPRRGQRRCRRLEDHLGSAAHANSQQIREAADQVVEIDSGEPGPEAVAEPDQVPGQIDGPVRRGAYLLEDPVQLRIAVVGGEIFCHLGVADDDGQQVAEVVGNTAGQLPNCLEALALPQLGYEPPPMALHPGHLGGVLADSLQEGEPFPGPAGVLSRRQKRGSVLSARPAPVGSCRSRA